MFAKLSRRSDPKRILVFSQTNIGDVVLTCPVIDILRRDFPRAKIDLIVGPKAASLFTDNHNFHLRVFDKRASFMKKMAWYMDLYKTRYDCLVDLRRTGLALFLTPKYATPLFPGSNFTGHKKAMHLNRLRQVYNFDGPSQKQYAIITTKEDEIFFEGAVAPSLKGQSFVVIAPGAASSNKRWTPEGFAAVADHLSVTHKVIFVGDANDVELVEDIQGRMTSLSLSLAGKINLRQLAFVLKKCAFAITHDSGVMHLACYFNVPVVALWGPTDIERYAPWSFKSEIVKRNEKCLRCQDPKSSIVHNCMSYIQVEDVINATKVIQ